MTQETLEERLAREHQLSPREAVRIGTSLAREVERRHRQGTRTIPIAPTAIALQGAAVILQSEGASAFPSPEELAGQAPDERTDVYRLGAIMYQMLTGRHPPEPVAVSRIATAPGLRPPSPPPSVHAVRRDVTRALDAAITRALSRHPQDRFARASQFAEVLDESLGQRLDHEPHSDRPSQTRIVDSWEFQEEERRAERRSRRQVTERRALVLLVMLTAVLVAVVVW